MVIRIDAEACNGCRACTAVCPVGALTVLGTARVDTTRCVKCRMCLTACPLKAIAWR